jgi:hypothetical protein
MPDEGSITPKHPCRPKARADTKPLHARSFPILDTVLCMHPVHDIECLIGLPLVPAKMFRLS